MHKFAEKKKLESLSNEILTEEHHLYCVSQACECRLQSFFAILLKKKFVIEKFPAQKHNSFHNFTASIGSEITLYCCDKSNIRSPVNVIKRTHFYIHHIFVPILKKK